MRDFLDFIQPPQATERDGDYVEIRSIRDGKVRQWWERDRQAAVDLALSQSDDGWDAYYGVLPRLEHAGDSSSISRLTPVLWADLDAKQHGSKQQCLRAIVQADVPPSVVVDSGHGYHAYWRLDPPVLYDEARPIMVGIARKLRGDHVYDQARILRIPGTINWKEPGSPLPVRVIVFDTTNIRPLRDFTRWRELGLRLLRPDTRVDYQYTQPSDREPLPDWLEQLIVAGVPQGERSEAAFKVMIYLLRYGWSYQEILEAFENGGIGEKMREQRGGQRWFDRSLEKARESL